MRRFAGTGHHQRRRSGPPPAPRPEPERVLYEAAAGDLTVDELRGWLADVDVAAEKLGVDPGGLRPWVAVRFSGAIRAICADIKVPKGGRRGAA